MEAVGRVLALGSKAEHFGVVHASVVAFDDYSDHFEPRRPLHGLEHYYRGHCVVFEDQWPGPSAEAVPLELGV